jgi:zinc transporter ZupT
LTIAIYFHTIFEGIAIGVQSSITGFLATAVAIAFHKWADALSMGCHYKSKNIKKSVSYSLIFIQALLNVLSIGVGWIISSSGDVV